MFEFSPAFLPINTDPLPLSNWVLPALSPIATTFWAFACAFCPIAIAFLPFAPSLFLLPTSLEFTEKYFILSPVEVELEFSIFLIHWVKFVYSPPLPSFEILISLNVGVLAISKFILPSLLIEVAKFSPLR